MRCYVHIDEGPIRQGGESPLANWRDSDWKPWINSGPESRIPELAAHQHVRFRGGVGRGAKVELQVYYFFADDLERPEFLHVTSFSCERK